MSLKKNIKKNMLVVSCLVALFVALSSFSAYAAEKSSTKTSITSLKRNFSRFVVKWNTSTSVSGYQVSYSTKSTMDDDTIVWVRHRTQSSYTQTSLPGNRTYYVRVRSYVSKQNTDGTYSRTFSSWSAIKSIYVYKLYAPSDDTFEDMNTIFIGDSLLSGHLLGNSGGDDKSKGWGANLVNLMGLNNMGIWGINGVGYSQGYKGGYDSLLDYATTISNYYIKKKTNEKVELIILGAGINDCANWNGYQPTYKQIKSAASKTFKILHKNFPNAKIVVFPVVDTLGTHYSTSKEQNAANAIIAAAASSGCVDYCSSICNKMLVGWNGGVISGDWHANEYGQKVIASCFAYKLSKAF